MLDDTLIAAARAQGITKIVVGAVVHRRGQALVVRRSTDDDFLPGIEEVPSGGLDAGETLTDGLARELHEEIGITDPQIDPGWLATFDYLSGSGSRTRQLTVSVPLGEHRVRLSDEHSAHRWIDADQVAGADVTAETAGVLDQWFRWRASSSA